MNMRVAKLLTLLIAPLFLSATDNHPASLDRLLRLRKGNYWIYSGTVKWDASQGRIGKAEIRWKSEIIDEAARGDLKAFLVEGDPTDLAWYTPGKKPGLHLWIVYKDRFYMVEADDAIVKRFKSPQDPLTDLVEAEDPVLQLPITLKRCTQPIKVEEPRERTDLMYCWYIDQKHVEQLNASGAPASAEVLELSNRTAPDDEELGVAPETGIVSYDYSHHGTVSEAHVKLVEAHLIPNK